MKMRIRMKYILLAVLGITLLSCGAKKNIPSARGAETKGGYSIIQAGKTNITQVLEESGVVAPMTSADVASRVSGRVVRIRTREGAYVKRGMIVADVEPDLLQTKTITAVVNNYEKAKIELRTAKDDYDQKKGLYDKGFIPVNEMKRAEDALSVAEMNNKAAKDEYERSRDEIGGTSGERLGITSQLTGIVLNRYVEEGELVVGESTMRSGTKLFTIADLSRLVVKVNINEVDIFKLGVGYDVAISIAANPNERYGGRVSKIAPYAEDRSGIKIFPTEITILKEDSRLRPGMSASIKASIKAKDNVLSVPVTALFIDEGGEYVFVPGVKGVEKRMVKRGINDTKMVEIVSGLKEGEKLYSDIPYKELAQKPAYVPVGGKKD